MTADNRNTFLLMGRAAGVLYFSLFLILMMGLTPCSAASFPWNSISDTMQSVRTAGPEHHPPRDAVSQTQSSTFEVFAADEGRDDAWRPSAYYVQAVAFEPERPVAGEPIKVEVYFTDHVKQPLPLLFDWKVNGETISETTNPEFQHPTKRGDRIEVIVNVGGNRGEASPVLGSVTVGNAAPAVKKLDERADDSGEYVAHLASNDPDGDAVTLILQKGPDGMTLDEVTGEVHWSIPNGTKGDFPVEVIAKDASGGEAIFSYSITVK